jgi:peptide/nickel transport system substrate-binding protein
VIGGKEYKLPFVDKRRLSHHQGRGDPALTALRTGKLDILENRSAGAAVDDLKKSSPQLKWSRWLATSGQFLAMRVDTKPFDDIRVRRALNMAVNKQEIIESTTAATPSCSPIPCIPTTRLFRAAERAMPASVKELFTFNPAKAKKLLAEAGYPNGFTFKVQVCSCNPDHMDLLPLVAAYLEAGRRQDRDPADGVWRLPLGHDHQTNAAGYFMNNGHTNPTPTIRKSFVKGQVWNRP